MPLAATQVQLFYNALTQIHLFMELIGSTAFERALWIPEQVRDCVDCVDESDGQKFLYFLAGCPVWIFTRNVHYFVLDIRRFTSSQTGLVPSRSGKRTSS